MKKHAYAIIGLNYGDEGKGLATDFFTRQLQSVNKAPTVVRCNGGAQAGHTVVTSTGSRHVFSHVGSGTFADAPTYLSSRFILNPYTIEKEIELLKTAGVRPAIVASHQCKVTTIFDMALNSLRELSRGGNRHGSCGLGINETVTRHNAGFQITAGIMYAESVSRFADTLEEYMRDWWKPELQRLLDSHDMQSEDFLPFLKVFEDIDFVQAAYALKKIWLSVPLVTQNEVERLFVRNQEQGFVIEGAQGLALDEHLGTFPHVTRSTTGLPSSLLAASEVGASIVQPIYITRAYATRHGAGPLKGEGVAFTKNSIPEDRTNQFGPWQGKFRYAPLNLPEMKQHLTSDCQRSLEVAKLLNIAVKAPNVMVTCMDHFATEIAVISDSGRPFWIQKDDLLDFISDYLECPVTHFSTGPTAADVHSVYEGWSK